MVNKRKVWYGSMSKRGGVTHDRWGNIKKELVTFRDRGNNIVVNEKGNVIGVEVNRLHHYGNDPKKSQKKPKGWYGESLRHKLAAKGIKLKR